MVVMLAGFGYSLWAMSHAALVTACTWTVVGSLLGFGVTECHRRTWPGAKHRDLPGLTDMQCHLAAALLCACTLQSIIGLSAAWQSYVLVEDEAG